MRRSCRNCKSYDYRCRYCFEFKIDISDVFNASYCKRYKEKRKEVKCINCKNNRNSYCSKKRCILKDEQKTFRVCKYFKSKFKKNIR